MLNTASLDTSAIVRVLVDENSVERRKALRLLDQGLTFRIADITLSETVYVLEGVYKKSRAEIGDLILFFLMRYADVIEYNQILVRAVLPFYLEHPKLSFNDCYLAAMAELNGAEPLFTLDQKLANQHPSAKLI